MSVDDTIYALSSGAGRGAISLIRISGRETRGVVEAIAGETSEPRHYQLRQLVDPRTGEILDQAIVVWLPGPHSFTGEDCAEFHVHASRAVLSAVFTVLAGFPGVRPAEAGEFTRRAFANGKMDLVEVEGLGDLLVAQTAAQRRQSLSHMLGKASSIFDSWRERLLLIRANIEAAVDFVEEEGVAEAVGPGIDGEIRVLLQEMETAVAAANSAEAIRDGVKVVLVGHPNTGKSSLLNAIARRDAAIVSATPGTTRDVIEVFLDIAGIPVVLTDTAGLRSGAADDIEVEGIRRSKRELEQADVIIWVSSPDVDGSEKYGPEIRPDLIVAGKCDLTPVQSELLRNESPQPSRLALSAATGVGIPELIESLTLMIKERFGAAESAVVVSVRQKEATVESIRMLNDSLRYDHANLELKAEDIRRAAEVIGRITGRTEVEEWLGVIFSKFCIGK